MEVAALPHPQEQGVQVSMERPSQVTHTATLVVTVALHRAQVGQQVAVVVLMG